MSIFRRKEFIRVAPEEVGVPSEAQTGCLTGRERTEPHGLMLMRKGKIFAEGWWSPTHRESAGLQSHTKTYAATVGIAYTEDLLSLDERIIDIFPDKGP